MQRFKGVAILAMVLAVLTGCGESEPLTLSEEHAKYIGVWQHILEKRTDTRMDVDNMQLVILPDGSASFRQCFITMTSTDGSRRSSSKRVNFPDAYITAVEDGEITIEQSQEVPLFGNIALDYDLVVSIEPYEEDGRVYMEVEETLLTRLNNEEINSQTDWVCPELEDDDEF